MRSESKMQVQWAIHTIHYRKDAEHESVFKLRIETKDMA